VDLVEIEVEEEEAVVALVEEVAEVDLVVVVEAVEAEVDLVVVVEAVVEEEEASKEEEEEEIEVIKALVNFDGLPCRILTMFYFCFFLFLFAVVKIK